VPCFELPKIEPRLAQLTLCRKSQAHPVRTKGLSSSSWCATRRRPVPPAWAPSISPA